MPSALTSKSTCGSRAAQSCDGWAAVWITSSIAPACSAKTESTRSRSRMSISSERNSGIESTRLAVTDAVDASGPKNCARMSFSSPITS